MITSPGSTPPGSTPLGLDPDELVACVSCGLCLPHCPTYRVTGLEIASPRGRITAMRTVESGLAPIDEAFTAAMHACVQCRGCEAACPSGVAFGHLIEGTRARLAANEPTDPNRGRRSVSRVQRLVRRALLGRALTWSWLLRLSGWGLVIGRVLHVIPRRLRSTAPNLRPFDVRVRSTIERGGRPDVWLFTGCVMDAWMGATHNAAAQAIRATGATVGRAERNVCCGALALHAGEQDLARNHARRVVAAFPGAAPIVVDAAGCGAALKEYGDLLDDASARAFSARVYDVHEWLASERSLPLRTTGTTVVVHDACHLRHVQRCHTAVRSVLGGAYDLVEPADEGMCCGAGGAYAATQPELAGAIGERKAAALRAVGADRPGVVVASANPGCTIQLRALGFEVRHPVELLADALIPQPAEHESR